AAGGRLHPRPQGRAGGGPATRVRRGHDQRGADVPRRPDALRRRQGFRQHPGGAGVGDPRAHRGASRSFGFLISVHHPEVSGILGIGIGLLVLGLIALVFFPWGGVVAAVVGLVLIVLFLAGVGRATPRGS